MALSDFQPVIGLEVHAQLLTRSKLFSSAGVAFGAAPNTHTTPVCLGFPGAMPVLNEKVVELAVRAGLALECRINERSEWSRKHYFYPDSPKGYQITQYEFPICEWGGITLEVAGKRVQIRRIHIEEDAGKSVHDAVAGLTLVDLNRVGTPLLEIVSEPDLRSADEAVEYLKILRDVLVSVGVNDGNLEEGSFRCDANVSIMKKGAKEYGTRCELKNLNSFRNIKLAIDAEIARHVEVIEGGGSIVQETRLFDVARGETRSMRSKEDAHDYRYFPEPDLPPLLVSAEQLAQGKASLPELPQARRRRYVEQLKLTEYDAGVLTADRELSELYERCLAPVGDAKKVANWFIGEVSRLLNESGVKPGDVKFTPAQFATLLHAIESGEISQNAGKEVFASMFASGAEPKDVIASKGLAQVSDTGALEKVIDEILAANPKNVEGYRAGNTKLLGFFVGAVMKSMKGKGNPKLINELLEKKLEP
ncbi:MAG: Asp-tRNA(Asn)/Glu-tRNA(Gln) amidotransferase subunit GatB [Archangium sp.]|nr:Asp-tRNA(Asn)/Glu-tRNA(Gln) amidotransferase subunit GatB [Archangium sp.]